LALAYLIEREVEAGRLKDYAAVARLFGITRARVSQILDLLSLSPELQESILTGRLAVSERRLRRVTREVDWEAQVRLLGGNP
jgi:hypothetical protein